MRGSLTIIFGIIASALFLLGIYGAYNLNRNDYSALDQERLEQDLIFTKAKLQRERQKLAGLEQEFRNAFPFGVAVQAQMQAAAEIVGKTDFMFQNADTLDPEFILKNIDLAKDIDTQRKNINLLIANWKNISGTLDVGSIGLAEGEKVQKDITEIQLFISSLSKILADLAPDGSELTQFEIYTYISQIPSVNSVTLILNSLAEAVNSYNDGQLASPPAGFIEQNTIASFVTVKDIVAQQGIVANTEQEVARIEENLAQIQNIPEVQNTAPQIGVPQTYIPVNNQYITNGEYVNPRTINKEDFEGIIIQPGPPKLIQGTDQF